MNPFYRAIARAIGEASGRSFAIQSISHLGGGCINETVKLAGTDGSAWFLKSNTSADTTMFAAEFEGLKALGETNTVRVPRPLVYGESEGQSWLAMELLELGCLRTDGGDSHVASAPLSRPAGTLSPVPNGGEGRRENSPNPDSRVEPPNRRSPLFGVPALAGPAGKVGGSRDRLKPGLPTAVHGERASDVRQTKTRFSPQEQLGRELAALHRNPQPHFGWHRDNTIGSTPQRNPPSKDWIEFWREHRLGFQLELAARHGERFSGANQLLDRLGDLFEDYEPQPSLLHGDLWSGNVGSLGDGSPVIFDPACYFGDREAEFGIIVMFGGFNEEFHRGYNSIWPLDEGFQRRLPLYELYHTLNHFNLFGGGYAASCQRLIDQLRQSQ